MGAPAPCGNSASAGTAGCAAGGCATGSILPVTAAKFWIVDETAPPIADAATELPEANDASKPNLGAAPPAATTAFAEAFTARFAGMRAAGLFPPTAALMAGTIAAIAAWLPATANDPAPPVMIIDVYSRTEKALNDNRYELLDKLILKNK